jgi:serine/threonine protein kinase
MVGAYVNIYHGVLLAKGTFSCVYVDPKDESVAVKVMDDVDLAIDEIGMMRALEHPNIVKMLDHQLIDVESDTGQSQRVMAIRMPRAKMTLHEHIRKVSSLSLVIQHAMQILRALAYLHDERHMMHRDLKPNNILFEPGSGRWVEGRVMLADFGTSTWIRSNRSYSAPVSMYIYSAPETILEEYRTGPCLAQYNGLIDVFAFGCIFWEMLTRGKYGPLFGKETENEETAQKQHGEFLSRYDNFEHNMLKSIRDPRVAKVLLGCLQPHPRNRISAQRALLHFENAESESPEGLTGSGMH